MFHNWHYKMKNLSYHHYSSLKDSNIQRRGGNNSIARKSFDNLQGGYVCPWCLLVLDQLWDLRANQIHISIALEKYEEALELIQGRNFFFTAYAGVDGLYEIAIKAISPFLRDEEEIPMAARDRGPGMIARNLARKEIYNLHLTTSTLSDIWHKILGHPGTTIFKRMLPVLVGHNLATTDANKTILCEARIQEKMIKRPSQWQLPTELPPPYTDFKATSVGWSTLFQVYSVTSLYSYTHQGAT